MIYKTVTDYLSKTSITYKTSTDGAEAIICCPFCEDTKFHLYVHNTEGCYLCHKCGMKGSWQNLLDNLGIKDEAILESKKGKQKIEYKAKLNTTKLDKNLAAQYHEQLPERIQTYLKDQRGITDESITKYQIGWDGKSITIPVFDKEGNLINVRHRRDPEKQDGNKMWNEKGGKAALFNIATLEEVKQNGSSFVVITEGEFDAIVTNQNGFPAVSGTAGAATFKKDWVSEFDGIDTIYICYDTDDAGKQGAEAIGRHFGKRAKIVLLSQERDDKVDTSDYFAKLKKTPDDFQKLLDEAKTVEIKPKDFEILQSELEEAVHPALDYYNDQLFIGNPLPIKIDGKEKTKIVIVTSNKEKTVIEKGTITIKDTILPVRKVSKIPGKISRWSVSDIRKFLESSTSSPSTLAFIEIRQTLLKFVDFRNDTDADILSLWIMGTYLFPIFDAFPYIYLVGVKRSGKTKTLLLIEKLAFNAILSSNISPSVLFRIVEAKRCTLALDESEQLSDKTKKEELRELLNSGYKQGAPAYRVKKGAKGNFEIESFEIYSPKAIANISGLDNVLEDRSITITMVRTNNPEKGNLAVTEGSENWQYLRSLLYIFALDYAKEIAGFYHSDPEVNALLNRQNELWRPLLCIAKLLDKDLPGTFEQIKEEAIRRAQETSGSDLEDFDAAVLLALRELTSTSSLGYITNKEIKQRASEFLEEDQKQYFTSRGVGAALKRFGIIGKKVQGYWRYVIQPETIEELMKRYGIDPNMT